MENFDSEIFMTIQASNNMTYLKLLKHKDNAQQLFMMPLIIMVNVKACCHNYINVVKKKSEVTCKYRHQRKELYTPVK